MRRFAPLVLLIVCGAVFAQTAAPTPSGPQSFAQQAQRMFETAQSQLQAKQIAQAAQVLEQFVKLYPTNENVPVAYLMAADCRRDLKQPDAAKPLLDEVIKRFPGSATWFRAYGGKLRYAKEANDRDGYLTLLEEMIRQCGRVPILLRAESVSAGSLFRYDYWAAPGLDGDEPVTTLAAYQGWIEDVVKMADTPERAQRALKALANSFKAYKDEMPVHWQFAHVTLLRNAGQAEEAEKTFQGYVDGWGDDPRAIQLWLRQAAYAERQKDPAVADEVYKRLIETYGGWTSLEAPLLARIQALAAAGRYPQFAELARAYLSTYGQAHWPQAVLEAWVGLARSGGKGKEKEEAGAARLTEALEALEPYTATTLPHRRRLALGWKAQLLADLGKVDQAVALAQELVSPKCWSAESFAALQNLADRNEAFRAVVESARKTWGVPAIDESSKTAGMLKDLQKRLADEEIRHAVEIGEELFGQHKSDAATIEAVKALTDYYYRKVERQARDKWVEAMISAYPTHPLTQAVLARKVETDAGENNRDGQAKALDMLLERFPASRDWCPARMALLEADAKRELARKVYGAEAEAGDVDSINAIAALEEPDHTMNRIERPDWKGLGDYWMGWAKKVQGKRAELHCLGRAWAGYYAEPLAGFWQNRRAQPCLPQAMEVCKAIQAQKMNPELSRSMALADIDILVRANQAPAALAALKARLDAKKKYRDLSLLVNLPILGAGLVQAGMGNEALALADTLGRVCSTTVDLDNLDIMRASAAVAARQEAMAARFLLRIVDRSPWPAMRYGFFSQAIGHLRGAEHAAAIQGYLARVPNVQELVPRLLFAMGNGQLPGNTAGAMEARRVLAARYPASSYLDELDKLLLAARPR